MGGGGGARRLPSGSGRDTAQAEDLSFYYSRASEQTANVEEESTTVGAVLSPDVVAPLTLAEDATVAAESLRAEAGEAAGLVTAGCVDAARHRSAALVDVRAGVAGVAGVPGWTGALEAAGRVHTHGAGAAQRAGVPGLAARPWRRALQALVQVLVNKRVMG